MVRTIPGAEVMWKPCLVLSVSTLAAVVHGSVFSPNHPTTTATAITPTPTLLTSPGESVTMAWPLPPRLRGEGGGQGGLLLVSFRRPSTVLFLLTLLPSSSSSSSSPPSPGASSPVVMPDYSERIQIAAENLSNGTLQFTLQNVSFADAGKYMCTRGFAEADVLEDCGSTLVVVGAPVNATVTAQGGPPLTGTDVTLRCAAASVSAPRDHRQPMRFRWFESGRRHPALSDWTEIDPIRDPRFRGAAFEDEADPGSGEADPEAAKGSHSGSTSDVLRMTSLVRSDDGRQLACAASEGLELWSAKSEPFVLRPDWKPLPSDLTLTPEGSSMTLTSGESQNVTCHARCRPDCSILWKKVTSDKHGVTLSRTRTLSLARVGPLHQGMYRCQASNPHGAAFVAFTLSVTEPAKPWYRDNALVVMVVSVSAVGVALGMTGVAVVVYKCRQRTTPFLWPHRRVTQDAVPLSMVDNRPSLSSYC